MLHRLLGSPITLLELSAALVVAGMVLAVFIRWEKRDRPELAVALVCAAILAQNFFYKSDVRVPAGVFRPGPIRTPELIIGAAVVARLWARPRAARSTTTGLAWLAFFVWYAAGVVIGLANGHSSTLVFFHARFIVYAGGAAILASGVPVRRLVSRQALGTWLFGLGGIVAAQVLFTITDKTIVFDQVGADAGSMYLGLAIVVLLVEGAERSRLPIALAMAPLLAAPLVTSQRASLVHAAASAVVIAFVLVGRTWSRRMSVRPTQLVLGGTALLAVCALIVLPDLPKGQAVPPTVSSTVTKTFGGLGNVQSAEARVNQWGSAKELLDEQPLFGQGLGLEHTYFKPGIWFTGEFQQANVFDNTILDLLVRSGVVGLLLFSLAIGFTIRDAWRVWVGHHDRRVAAFGLAAVAFLVGMLAKGAVESIFEKSTLACALGLVIGAVASATRELRSGERPYLESDGVIDVDEQPAWS